MRHSPRWGRVLAAAAALCALLHAAVAGLRAHYLSWHPCDWLLQDTVSRVLESRRINPDSASVVLRATTVESPEVQAVLETHDTPASCLITWASLRLTPQTRVGQ